MATFEVIGGPVTHRYLMGKTKSEIADMYMRMLRETAQDAREAELYRQQLGPVPAQGAEGVEALADRLLAYSDAEDILPSERADLQEASRRLRNSPESPDGSFSLLGILADIRAAAGDPTGRLMQDELVAHIRALRANDERYRWLRKFSSNSGTYDHTIPRLHHSLIFHGGWCDVLDAAIDAARSSEGGG